MLRLLPVGESWCEIKEVEDGKRCPWAYCARARSDEREMAQWKRRRRIMRRRERRVRVSYESW